MRYENSLTSNVEFYIDQILCGKLSARQDGWDLQSSARKFRDFLCDPSTVNTPDFVLRRYIQTRYPDLLAGFPDIADLPGDMNLAWEKDVIDELSGILERLSISHGCRLERKELRAYLSGTHIPSRREKAFMLAFILNMNVPDTLDLLLACDMEPYSPRYPLDLICLFCQKDPGRYTWAQARQMLQDFLERRDPHPTAAAAPTDGMTRQMTLTLEEIFRTYNESDGPAALVDYMAAHSGEFVSYRSTVRRKSRDPEGGSRQVQREFFIPGYSLARSRQFQQLTQYLAVLYPGYEQATRRNTITRGLIQATPYTPVPTDASGNPKLSTLVRAMLVSHRLLDLDWSDSVLHRDFIRDDAAMDYEAAMRRFWENYMQHISAVDRMLALGADIQAAENPNIRFFRRTDALVFLYFLIDGVRSACLGGDSGRLAALSRLSGRDTPFDQMMAQLIDKVDYLTTELTEEADDPERIDMLRTCFNMLLSHMGYTNLYLPSLFDRLFFTTLLSDFPRQLLPLILCYGEW